MFPYEETPGPHLDHPAGTSWFAAVPSSFPFWGVVTVSPGTRAPSPRTPWSRASAQNHARQQREYCWALQPVAGSFMVT